MNRPVDVLQRDEALAAALGIGQADEAVDRAGHADQRVHAAPVARARKLQRDGEAEIGNERERMRRIDRQRGQHREDVLQEMIVEPGLLGLGDVGAVDQDDVFLAQVLAQRAQARLLVGREAADRLADAHELLGRRQPVRALLDDALAHLVLQAGDAHHEEFVEVVGRDRQEAQPLQHRMVLVLGLFQHAAIEVQPGEFPVDEPFRAGGEVMQRRRQARAQLRPARRRRQILPSRQGLRCGLP